MDPSFRHLKAFGQHFLKSDAVAAEIVAALETGEPVSSILEIGPGLGILSRHLLKKKETIYFSEIDRRIITFLKEELQVPEAHILEGDFLRTHPEIIIPGNFAVIGNFPYNISSQIIFRVLEMKEHVPTVVGMFQKEMARRVTATHGNKEYGVVSVLTQAYYQTEYLMELSPDAFDPPPKVDSAVIRLQRRKAEPACSEKMLRQVVKAGFNQRRKKLSNALSGVQGALEPLRLLNFADKRAEQLSVEEFIELTTAITQAKKPS